MFSSINKSIISTFNFDQIIWRTTGQVLKVITWLTEPALYFAICGFIESDVLKFVVSCIHLTFLYFLKGDIIEFMYRPTSTYQPHQNVELSHLDIAQTKKLYLNC